MKKRVILSVLSGVLLALSFPPAGVTPLAWISFVPMFFAVEGAGLKRGFFLGYAAGLVFFLGTVYWVVHSMFYYGGIPIWTSVAVMLLLVAYLSVYPALFGMLLAAFSDDGSNGRTFYSPVFAACLWTALEYLRGHLFTGFPWSVLGYTQAVNTTLVQFSDITGVWGVSFLIVFLNAALYGAFVYVLGRQDRLPVANLVAALVMLTSAFAYGSMNIKKTEDMVRTWRPIKAAVIQGNIDQSLKWDRSFQRKTLEIYRDLTQRAAADGAELVIWPETAVPYYMGEDTPNDTFISLTARESEAYVLTGSPSFAYNAATHILNYFNSAYLIGPQGVIHGRYDKVHLVPFGEYVPLKRFLPFVKKLTEGVGDFASGPGPVPIDFRDTGIGVVICYEVIFPELSSGSVKNGAGLLVNITNDAWFGRTSAPYQHFEMSMLRAVENKVFLLRAANTGISAIVDPVGRVVGETPIFETTLLVDNIALKKGGLTFYTRHGDVFANACVVSSALFIFTAIFRLRRRKDVR